jgi:hypothetical protein
MHGWLLHAGMYMHFILTVVPLPIPMRSCRCYPTREQARALCMQRWAESCPLPLNQLLLLLRHPCPRWRVGRALSSNSVVKWRLPSTAAKNAALVMLPVCVPCESLDSHLLGQVHRL